MDTSATYQISELITVFTLAIIAISTAIYFYRKPKKVQKTEKSPSKSPTRNSLNWTIEDFVSKLTENEQIQFTTKFSMMSEAEQMDYQIKMSKIDSIEDQIKHFKKVFLSQNPSGDLEHAYRLHEQLNGDTSKDAEIARKFKQEYDEAMKNRKTIEESDKAIAKAAQYQDDIESVNEINAQILRQIGYQFYSVTPQEPQNQDNEFQKVKNKRKKSKDKEIKGEKGSKRPIVIDGLNIAKAYGNHIYGPKNGLYSAKGLLVCYQYFKKQNYQDNKIAIVLKHIPDRLWDQNSQQILEDLQSKKVIFDPSGRVVGNQRFKGDDDILALDIAQGSGAVIITLDNYRDHFERNLTYRDVIRYRLLQPLFLHEQVRFHPEPMGKNGPKLNDILQF